MITNPLNHLSGEVCAQKTHVVLQRRMATASNFNDYPKQVVLSHNEALRPPSPKPFPILGRGLIGWVFHESDGFVAGAGFGVAVVTQGWMACTVGELWGQHLLKDSGELSQCL
jgi:hypothetical protein